MELGRILNNDPSSPTGALEADPPKVRVGKWTHQEERYACALIKHFVAGTLSTPTGTSLRSFLAKKLRCSAIRVSTKLAVDALGDMAIPKRLARSAFFQWKASRRCSAATWSASLTRWRQHSFESRTLRRFQKKKQVCEGESHGDVLKPPSYNSEDESEGPMRVGSRSQEEQQYTCALIDAFFRDTVNAASGTTLRAFLSDRLSCNPMRISKKLATGRMASSALPKRLESATYRVQTRDAETIARTEHELEQLRLSCFPHGATPRRCCRHHHHDREPSYSPLPG